MSEPVHRTIAEPKRDEISYQERWGGPDKGLISCWETGREWRESHPDLAQKAEKGELPLLGWKGGVKKGTKIKAKYGTLQYLAKWQGLRGEDLDIDLDEDVVLVCAATGVIVTFTGDQSRYANT